MNWFILAKCFSEQANEVDRGTYSYDFKELRVLILRDISKALEKQGYKEQKPFRVEGKGQEGKGGQEQ